MEASNMQHCPVCLGRVSSELFSSHMNSHSKDDVVSALLRQPLPGSFQNLQSFAGPSLLQASNPGSNPALPTSIQNQVQNTLQAALSAPRTNVTSGSAHLDLTSQGAGIAGGFPGLHFMTGQPTVSRDLPSSPLIMPGMIPGMSNLGMGGMSTLGMGGMNPGMSMVMSPVLVPQQNGPPIIFNVPMMCPTPNMLNSSTAGSTSVSSALSPNATPAMSSQQSSSTLTLTPPPLVQKSSFLAATSLNLSQATTLSTPSSGRETRRELNPRPLPSLQQIPIQAAVALTSLDLTRNQMSPAKIIEKIEVKIENAMTTATSVLLSPKPGTSSSFKSATIPIAPIVENNSNNNDLVENQNAGFANSSPTKDPVSSPRKSPEKICTVETVSDLINAQMLLKSNEDIQIVVANDLLETSEFKTFMSHLNLPPQTPHPDDDREMSSNHVPHNTPMTTRPPSIGPDIDLDDPEEFPCDEPQPSTSRQSPQRYILSVPSDEDEDDLEDEDICLQDLVAMETMEQVRDHDNDDNISDCIDNDLVEDEELIKYDATSDENISEEENENEEKIQNNVVMETDDQVFTLASYKSSQTIEPSFVNAILSSLPVHPEEPSTVSFACEHPCGLHFPTHESYHMHRMDCKVVKGAKRGSKNGGTKAKRSQNIAVQATNLSKSSLNTFNSSSNSFEGLAEIKSEANSLMSSADLKVTASTSQNVLAGNLKVEKFENYLPIEQPALGACGAAGGNWKCSQCLASFTSGQELFQHEEELRKAEHKCLTCHVIFDNRKTVLAHKKEIHTNPGLAASNILNKIKIEEDSQLLDIKSDSIFPNEQGEFICEKCDRAFTNKELFVKHMSCHEEEKPFECLECGKKFAKAILLRDHRKRHFEKGGYECSYCPKTFFTPIKLREHVRVHTGETPLSCNICGKGFKRHSNLSEHKRIHDANRPVKPPKELFCHCGKMFTTKRELDWHTEEVHERVPKKCDHCGEVFVHSTSLTRHIRRKHQNDFVPDNKKASLSAKCPICNQTFYKTSINKHIRIKHEGQKPYVCEICKMGFVTKNNLENHQWQHKGIRSRPFKCQLCRKAYLRASQLEAHMRAHKGIKPFVCNECGLQFSNKSNWQRHVAEHSGDRNYSCPHCEKKFSRSYYLTDHMKVHTGVKPYSCAICGKTAATRSNYNSHLRTHITREPVNSEV